MARYALERIEEPQAAESLRQAVGKVSGDLKIGMIASLGARGDAASVPLLAELLSGDVRTAVAAAESLGRIACPEAMQALANAGGVTEPKVVKAIMDARLAGAEALLRQGKHADAMAVYKSIEASTAESQTRATKLAAARGVLACLDTSAVP
jgi:hypothetical protein